MKNKGKRGFTLIELLVVISIIGLLSSVVLASLSTARNKGRDAAIRQAVLQLRTLLTYELTDTGSYANLNDGDDGWRTAGQACTASNILGNYATQFVNICSSITKMQPACTSNQCLIISQGTAGSSDKFAIEAYLPSKNTYFCVGSSGGVSDTQATGIVGSSASGCYNNP